VLPSERGFIGQIEDTSTGLSYLNAPQYDTATATFLSVDPVFHPGKPMAAPYGYGDASPVGNSDPSGLIAITVCIPGYGCNEVDVGGDGTPNGSGADDDDDDDEYSVDQPLEERLERLLDEMQAWASKKKMGDCDESFGRVCYLDRFR
jgi:RHS repeat-associated protein